MATETDEIDPENPTPVLHTISQTTFSGLFTVLRYDIIITPNIIHVLLFFFGLHNTCVLWKNKPY